jgi:SAM-dependent methyltransferase
VHGQFYHDFFFHNWRTCEPAVVTTLINLGSPADPQIVMDTMDRAEDYFGAWIAHDVVSTPGEFLDCVRREADERSLESVTSGLDLQRDEHDYLDVAEDAADGTLSPVEQDFLDFLPDDCGVTLEIGGGYGHLGVALDQRARTYVNVELQHHYLRTDGGTRFGILGDFHKLPFRDNSFDMIIANNVLEHSYQPLVALSELKRILVSGGSLLAVIPLDALRRPD